MGGKLTKPAVPQEIEVVYFDIKARAEAIRLALHFGGVAFKDTRLKFPDWGELKAAEPEGGEKTGPLGQLPLLKIRPAGSDEVITFCQSHAILRYVGRLNATGEGHYPADNAIDALTVDMALDSLEDTFPKNFGPIMREKDEERKAALVKETVEEKLPASLSKLDALIAKCNGKAVTEDDGKTTWLSDKLTIADFETYSFVEMLHQGFITGIPTDIVKPYKNLMGVYNTVASHPKVKEFNEKVQASASA